MRFREAQFHNWEDRSAGKCWRPRCNALLAFAPFMSHSDKSYKVEPEARLLGIGDL
jgi:hypothetical protein